MAPSPLTGEPRQISAVLDELVDHLASVHGVDRSRITGATPTPDPDEATPLVVIDLRDDPPPVGPVHYRHAYAADGIGT